MLRLLFGLCSLLEAAMACIAFGTIPGSGWWSVLLILGGILSFILSCSFFYCMLYYDPNGV
jgi:hypothetical protein